ncbi:hypothetical protein CVT24_005955 [Panaeolus cyanescens]|uniref:Uncharacterized protein n=1 Tax=Panaeolus cyanescens TaxID=181874 RepID=A0A409YE54_9AGAR|nr:hypothetical protein CVT24_005955 [Panaeolus cyanescens]
MLSYFEPPDLCDDSDMLPCDIICSQDMGYIRHSLPNNWLHLSKSPREKHHSDVRTQHPCQDTTDHSNRQLVQFCQQNNLSDHIQHVVYTRNSSILKDNDLALHEVLSSFRKVKSLQIDITSPFDNTNQASHLPRLAYRRLFRDTLTDPTTMQHLGFLGMCSVSNVPLESIVALPSLLTLELSRCTYLATNRGGLLNRLSERFQFGRHGQSPVSSLQELKLIDSSPLPFKILKACSNTLRKLELVDTHLELPVPHREVTT